MRRYAPGRATRALLIRTAERLFAEHGIDPVSLRQIGIEAGQRNTAAARYYFGNKDGLVRAIFEFRLQEINARRLAMLDDLVRDGRGRDLRAVLDAYVVPLLEQIRPDNRYIEFLARLPYPPETHPFWTAEPELTSSARRVRELLEDALGHLPPPLPSMRVTFALHCIVHALADRQAVLRDHAGDLPPTALFLANLLDATTAALAASASTDALRQLKVPSTGAGPPSGPRHDAGEGAESL